MNAFERRQEERKVRQQQRNLHRRMDSCVKQHGIILRFEKAHQEVFGAVPQVTFNNGRYYVGKSSYQEQALLHKIREMEASLHERELVNEV